MRHFLLVAIAIVLAVVLGRANTQSSVTVRLPEWARAATCRTITNDTTSAVTQDGSVFQFRCSAEEARIACEGPGIEPRDFSLREVCRTGDLTLRQALDAESLCQARGNAPDVGVAGDVGGR